MIHKAFHGTQLPLAYQVERTRIVASVSTTKSRPVLIEELGPGLKMRGCVRLCRDLVPSGLAWPLTLGQGTGTSALKDGRIPLIQALIVALGALRM